MRPTPPMDDRYRTTRAVQVMLTITALEFFGPILRDYSASHALNPAWVGHARVHLVWLLGFMFLSGLANLWLIWWRRPFDTRNLWLSVLWQSCNLGGFWVAYALVDSYHGLITVPGEHVKIFGWDENVLVFTLLSIVMGVAVVLLATEKREAPAHATS